MVASKISHEHNWSLWTIEGGPLVIRCRDCGFEYEWVPDEDFGKPITGTSYRSGIAVTDGKSVKYLDSLGHIHPMPFPE